MMKSLSDKDLLELLDNIESDRAERKSSWRGDVPNKARQAICAFANDLPGHNQPGVLFIGANDDGTPSHEPYDLHPVPNASLSDLSRALFEDEYLPGAFAPDVLAENNRTLEERLASCQMVMSPDDPVPTILGLLSIGKKPQNFLPGACIQFLRIDGTEYEDEVVDEARIGGAFVDMLNRTTDKLIAHNRRAFDVTSGDMHKITSDYPIAAIQQIVYNAVMHRTYENTHAPARVYWFNDRIEVINPGGLYGNVTPEKFGKPGFTDYRNPNLAASMKVLGIVQGFGRGLNIARGEMKRNGNPEIEFELDQTLVSCILRKRI